MKYAEHKTKYNKMLREAHKQGLRVRSVGARTLHDYAGMNNEAAREFGMKMPRKTILLAKGQNYKQKANNLEHELVERRLMKKGMPYWKAHQQALRLER
jgi:hypothetical protein